MTTSEGGRSLPAQAVNGGGAHVTEPHSPVASWEFSSSLEAPSLRQGISRSVSAGASLLGLQTLPSPCVLVGHPSVWSVL